MSAFKKAKAEQAALKIGFYGSSGSGKTFTSLLCAEGLAQITGKRVAFIDTERGTDFYCQTVQERKIHPQAFDFDAIYTRSLTEVLAAVKSIKEEEHGVLILDSITHIWEAAKLAYTGKETSIGTIPFHAWAKIKKPYKELINFILNSKLHVFICGRQGNEFEEEDGELKKVGTKMKAEGETAYEPHILIHMENVKHSNGMATISAFAEKDRTGILAGKTIHNPCFDNLIKPLLPLLGNKQAQMQSEDETTNIDIENLHAQDAEKDQRSNEILCKMTGELLLCETLEVLKKISTDITNQKKFMTKSDIDKLRETYITKNEKLKK